MSRWQWVMLLVMVSTGLTWFFASRDGGGKVSHGGCLADADCINGERCAIVPKGDGFATFGLCADACTEATTCLNGYLCTPFVETQGALYAVGSREAKAQPNPQRRTVCAPKP